MNETMDLSKLSDTELEILLNDVMDEVQKRGMYLIKYELAN